MSASLTCEAVGRALLGEPPKKKGAELLWPCPRHDDNHPSFQVNPHKGDKGAWMCGPCGASGRGGWSLAAFVLNIDPNDKPAMTAALRERGLLNGSNGNGGGKKIVATYDYVDEVGKLLYQNVRYDPKDFRQRSPDGHGDWIWNLNGVPRVIYNLPEVLKAQFVIWCEGERDEASARTLGLVAATSGSAKSWRPEFAEYFRGKRVAIVVDADEPGRKHARRVAADLVGVAESVRLLELPGAKDLTEWVEKGGTKDKFLELAEAAPVLTADEEVRHIATSVSSYEPGAKNNQGSASKTESSQKPALQLTPLGALLSQPEEAITWTVDGVLTSGGLNLVIAKPKVGKSTWARCLAFAVAKGLPFMGRATEQGTVLYLALEEKKSEVVKHFRSLGATKDDPILIHCAHAPDGALLELRLLAEKHKPVLIIIDPLLKLVRVRDANAYAEMTNALEPLSILARETGACVVAAHHAGKAERAEAMDSIIGSSAIFGGIDTAILMKRTERYRIIQSQQRYGVDLPETVLDLDPETRMVALGVLKSNAETSRIGECIIEHLKGVSEPITEKQILSEIEGKQRTKWEGLRDLYASGKLSRSGGGKRGDPYLYSIRVGENKKVGETETPADQVASLDSSYSPTPHPFGIRVGETQKLSKGIENTEEKLLPDLRTGPDTTGNAEYEKKGSSVREPLSSEEPDFLEI